MFAPFLSGMGAIQADGSQYSMQKVKTESQGMGLLSLDLPRLSLLPAGAYIMEVTSTFRDHSSHGTASKGKMEISRRSGQSTDGRQGGKRTVSQWLTCQCSGDIHVEGT